MVSIGPSLLVCPFSSGLASVFLQSQVCEVRLSVKGWVDQSSDGLLSLVLFFYWCWQRWYRVSQMDIQTIDNQGWSPRNHLTNLTFKKNLMGSLSLCPSRLYQRATVRIFHISLDIKCPQLKYFHNGLANKSVWRTMYTKWKGREERHGIHNMGVW